MVDMNRGVWINLVGWTPNHKMDGVFVLPNIGGMECAWDRAQQHILGFVISFYDYVLV